MVTVLHQRLKQGEEVTDEELEMAFAGSVAVERR